MANVQTVSANCSVTWTSPDGGTGSGTFTQGASLTIPAGSTVVLSLSNPIPIQTWSVAFNADNEYFARLAQQAAGSQNITFTMPLAPSVVRMYVSASGILTGRADITGTIVYADPGQGGEALVNVVTAFGVDNTGATDAGPDIQAALNALAGTGQMAYFPAGTYLIETPVTPGVGQPVYQAQTGVTFSGTNAAWIANQALVFGAAPGTPAYCPA
jgi:hypothetical protein